MHRPSSRFPSFGPGLRPSGAATAGHTQGPEGTSHRPSAGGAHLTPSCRSACPHGRCVGKACRKK